MTRAETIALLGRLAEALGLALLIPLAVALAHGEPAWLAFAAPAALGLGVGALSRRFAPLIGRSGSSTDGSRAYRFVVLAWCLCTVFGALPYVAEFGFGFVVNGLFESASGFSTTGATIFPEVEWLPRSLLLWRAMTQWLGGLGIIIIFVWLLGRRQWGVDVLSAEAPGPTAEKTEPKITETARDTVIVGSVLTAILIGILLFLDVPAFDAVCHAFTTLATGGFSTRNASVGAFDPVVQWVIIAFMVIGGMRFAIHIYEVKRIVAGARRLWRRLRGGPWKRVSTAPAASYFSDPELRLYIGVVAVSTGLLFLSLYLMGQGSVDGPAPVGVHRHRDHHHDRLRRRGLQPVVGLFADAGARPHVRGRLRRLDGGLDQDPALGDPVPEGAARAQRWRPSPTPNCGSTSGAARFPCR